MYLYTENVTNMEAMDVTYKQAPKRFIQKRIRRINRRIPKLRSVLRNLSVTLRRISCNKRREYGAYKMIPGGQNLHIIFNWSTFEDSKKFKTREGSENDVSTLKTTFKKLGYKVENYSNLNKAQFIDKLDEIRNITGVNSIIITIMSHGDGKDTKSFVTADCESFSMDNVLNTFSDTNCPGLRGKPKLFLANFCRDKEIIEREEKAFSTNDRGETMGVGEYSTESGCVPLLQQGLPVSKKDWEDICVIYGCECDIIILRDPSTGSFFIQSFCKIIRENRNMYNPHMNNLFLKLQREMKTVHENTENPISLPQKHDYLFKTFYPTSN